MSEESNVQSAEVTSQESTEQLVESSQGSDGQEIEVNATTENELQEEIDKAVEKGASEEQIKNMIRTFNLKVNGKEYVRKIDLSDEEALKNELQLALAGRQAMQRSRELEKLYQQEIHRLKTDTASVLKELGIDPLQFSSEFIEKYLQQQQKSPEELEVERRLKEYEQIKAENERLKREREEAERNALMSKIEMEIENDIISALDSDPDLPATPEVIARVADTLLWAMNNGYDNVTAKDVIPTVKKEIQEQFRRVASSLKSPTAIKAFLGEDVLKNLREERLQQASKQLKTVSNLKQPLSQSSQKEERPKKKLSDLLAGR